MQKFESMKHKYIQLLNNSNLNPPTLAENLRKRERVPKMQKPCLKILSRERDEDKKSQKTIGKKDIKKAEFSKDYVLS